MAVSQGGRGDGDGSDEMNVHTTAPPPPPSSSVVVDRAGACFNTFPDKGGHRLDEKVLPHGGVGVVRKSCLNTNCPLAVRFISYTKDTEAGVARLIADTTKLAEHNIGPTYKGWKNCADLGVVALITDLWDEFPLQPNEKVPVQVVENLILQIETIHHLKRVHTAILKHNVLVRRDQNGGITEATVANFEHMQSTAVEWSREFAIRLLLYYDQYEYLRSFFATLYDRLRGVEEDSRGARLKFIDKLVQNPQYFDYALVWSLLGEDATDADLHITTPHAPRSVSKS